MKFNLSTFFLFTALICVAFGWFLEHRYYQQKNDRTEMVLTRWCGSQKAVDIAIRWKFSAKASTVFQEELRSFGTYLDSELLWVITEAFELEDELARLDYSPNSKTLAKEVMAQLDCSSPAQFRNLVVQSETYQNQQKDLFPHFLDKGSESYTKFDSFLSRVFEME